MMVVGCARMLRLRSRMETSGCVPVCLETIETHESCPGFSSTRAPFANSPSTHPPHAHSVPLRALTASHSSRPPKAETSVPPKRPLVSRTLLRVHRMPGWAVVLVVALAEGFGLRVWCVSADEGRRWVL